MKGRYSSHPKRNEDVVLPALINDYLLSQCFGIIAAAIKPRLKARFYFKQSRMAWTAKD